MNGICAKKALICRTFSRAARKAITSSFWILLTTHGGTDSGQVRTIHDVVRVKEPGLEKRLFTDWYRRTSLLDHFIHPNTKIDDFFRCQYGEQGDFIKTTYQVDVVEDKHPQIRLSRLGAVWTGDQKNMVSVEKTLSFTDAKGWQVVYRIQNVHGAGLPAVVRLRNEPGLLKPSRAGSDRASAANAVAPA